MSKFRVTLVVDGDKLQAVFAGLPQGSLDSVDLTELVYDPVLHKWVVPSAAEGTTESNNRSATHRHA
jgi:hypothetical protein